MNDSQDAAGEEKLQSILMRTGPRMSPPENVTREVKTAVLNVWREEVARTKRARQSRWLAMAAAVILLLTGGILQFEDPVLDIAAVDRVVNDAQVLVEGNWQALSGARLVPDTRLRTMQDAYVSVSLDNGMNIRLDENTEMVLDGPDSVQLVYGRLYVDSNHKAVLVVNTAFGSAADIGTQFTVSATDANWQVHVREGSVLVKDDEVRKIVEVGQGLQISASNELSQSRNSPMDDSWQWVQKVTPVFSIEGRTLADYLVWISRETGREVDFRSEFARSAAQGTILHGSIDGLEPSESLAVVLSTTDFELVGEDDKSVLIDKAMK